MTKVLHVSVLLEHRLTIKYKKYLFDCSSESLIDVKTPSDWVPQVRSWKRDQ